MKPRIILISLLLLLLTLACVCSGSGPQPTPVVEVRRATATPELTPEEEPAGNLTPERDVVEHGDSANSLQQLFSAAAFFEGDFMRISQGGEALMEIGTDLWLRLFNDSELNVVSVEAAEGTPLDVQLFLADGGFTGQLTAENGQAQFETPNGVTVTILGTSFFVGYDPSTADTTLVNFEGSIMYEDGSGENILAPGFMVTAPSGRQQEITPISMREFEANIRRMNSSLDAARGLTCNNIYNPAFGVIKQEEGGFEIRWEYDVNCPPYKGVLTGRYSDQDEPFVTYDINEPSGSIVDQPPFRCEGSFTIVYELTLSDALEREVSVRDTVEALFIC
jgi:hypothetical protein